MKRRKGGGGPVIVLPKWLLSSPEWRALGANAIKLLMAVLPQYNGPGRNNGDLRIYTRAPDRYGFASVDTITRARDELIAKGFLQVTRMGGKNSRYQYALSWVEIDPVAGIEVKASSMPSHLWRGENANQRELRVPGKRRSKNENPVPTIGTTYPMTVPTIGTQASATVPTIGTANRDKQRVSEGRVVPTIGTDSWVAMGRAAVDLGLKTLTLDLDRAPERTKKSAGTNGEKPNERDRAHQRWQTKQARQARAAATRVPARASG